MGIRLKHLSTVSSMHVPVVMPPNLRGSYRLLHESKENYSRVDIFWAKLNNIQRIWPGKEEKSYRGARADCSGKQHSSGAREREEKDAATEERRLEIFFGFWQRCTFGRIVYFPPGCNVWCPHLTHISPPLWFDVYQPVFYAAFLGYRWAIPPPFSVAC